MTQEKTYATSPADDFRPLDPKLARRRRTQKWLAAGCVAAVLLGGISWQAQRLLHTRSVTSALRLKACGGVHSGVTKIDGQCIGVTDGHYVFDPAYADVEAKIAAENAKIGSSPAVTVALLDPMTPDSTSALDSIEIRAQLEGAFLAQYRTNSHLTSSKDTHLRLVLANEGGHEKQWPPVVHTLIAMMHDNDPLVAVAGLGVSVAETQRGAMALSAAGLPTIGVITTADQLNSTAIRGFTRVVPASRDYVASLRHYLVTRQDLKTAIVVSDSNSTTPGDADLFTASIRTDLNQQMKNWIKFPEQSFVGSVNPGDARFNMFGSVTPNLCAVKPNVVFFAGRQRDLRSFLTSVEGRVCVSDPMTIMVAGSDLGAFKNYDQILRDKKISLIYASGTDANSWTKEEPGTPAHFNDFLAAYTQQGFPISALADGESMSGHDAILAAAMAIKLAVLSAPATANGRPTAGDVLSQLVNLNTLNYVQGATGDLSYSNRGSLTGDPSGKPVPVLQIPSNGRFATQVPGKVYLTP